MPKIVTVQQMRDLEAAADAAGHTYAEMMEQAGRAIAQRVLSHLSFIAGTPHVIVLVGSGNNGADGLVAARVIKEAAPDTEICAYLLAPRPEDDPHLVNGRQVGLFIVDYPNDTQNRVLKTQLASADILIDALFGLGTRLPLEGDTVKLLREVKGILTRRENARWQKLGSSATLAPNLWHHDDLQSPVVIAVDCPSGVDCDSGALDPNTLPADETITFGAVKAGLLTFPAAEVVGELHIAAIGLPEKLKEWKGLTDDLSDGLSVRGLLPKRLRDAHKGTFGKAFIVAGSINTIGAATLSALGAYRIGAGLVKVGIPQPILSPLAASVPEATWVLLPNDLGVVNKAAAKIVREESAGFTALLVGPGIGDEDETQQFIETLLQNPKDSAAKPISRSIGLLPVKTEKAAEEKSEAITLPPLVIDADGLNAIAKLKKWHKLLPANTILTPHPREFARLAGLDDIEAIQADRVALARAKAAEWKAIVVLKGAHTVVATPDGRVTVSPFADAKLATAGTGDVLAGAIAGLLAQGLAPYDAAVAGVWLHGWAGTHGVIESVALASDVAYALSEALAALS